MTSHPCPTFRRFLREADDDIWNQLRAEVDPGETYDDFMRYLIHYTAHSGGHLWRRRDEGDPTIGVFELDFYNVYRAVIGSNNPPFEIPPPGWINHSFKNPVFRQRLDDMGCSHIHDWSELMVELKRYIVAKGYWRWYYGDERGPTVRDPKLLPVYESEEDVWSSLSAEVTPGNTKESVLEFLVRLEAGPYNSSIWFRPRPHRSRRNNVIVSLFKRDAAVIEDSFVTGVRNQNLEGNLDDTVTADVFGISRSDLMPTPILRFLNKVGFNFKTAQWGELYKYLEEYIVAKGYFKDGYHKDFPIVQDLQYLQESDEEIWQSLEAEISPGNTPKSVLEFLVRFECGPFNTSIWARHWSENNLTANTKFMINPRDVAVLVNSFKTGFYDKGKSVECPGETLGSPEYMGYQAPLPPEIQQYCQRVGLPVNTWRDLTNILRKYIESKGYYKLGYSGISPIKQKAPNE